MNDDTIIANLKAIHNGLRNSPMTADQHESVAATINAAIDRIQATAQVERVG